MQDRLGCGIGCRALEHVGEHSVLVATHVDHRVDHQVDPVALATKLHRGRVDQERHVVGHHLDHGVWRGPTIALGVGVVDPHLGFGGGAFAGECPMGDRGAV